MNRAIRPLFAAAFLLALCFTPAAAQCDHNPTVTPDDLILCPNSTGELNTQVYDSYQWYKAGEPIAGATGPILTVDAFNDAAYMFSVEATLNGCTEMSPEVLVDGWAFLLPFAMTSDNYLTMDGSTAVYCGGDSAFLVLMPPYDTNIQWTNNGTPIPGATDDTLFITEPGNFSVSGAPSICPGFIQQLGVTVPIAFQEPIEPMIMVGDASICAMPEGVAYQWYLNGAPIAGDTPCIVAAVAGAYTVSVTYDPDCSVPSEPYVITGMDDPAVTVPRISPMPAQDAFTLTGTAGRGIGAWTLLDATGRIALQNIASTSFSVRVDVHDLRPGAYWLRIDGYAAAPVIITR